MDARDVMDYLEAEEDEKAVLSAILERDADGWELIAASLLIGPKEMATLSWPSWRRASGISHARPSYDPPEFVHDLGRWKVGRVAMEMTEAATWLRKATDQPGAAKLGPETATASLSAASCPMHFFPGVDTTASQLMAATVRPVRGFFFPIEEGRSPRELDWEWVIAGQTVFNAPYELLGIFISNEERQSMPTPAGLLVGRLERRAWITSSHGGENLGTFDVNLGLDTDRVDIAELEIEYEERLDDEVILNQRVRLEEVEISTVRQAPDVTVRLPTMGTKVAHAVRLRDRDGALLDMTDPHYLLENIHLTVAGGGREDTIVIGRERPRPTLVARAQRVHEVIEEYRKWFEAGIDGKVFEDEVVARAALVEHLSRAHGALAVSDPYFAASKPGPSEQDWKLLRGLGRSIMVLTSERAKPVSPSPSIPGLQVRVWKDSSGRVPFHDRFYLWDGGGLNVGTSPNGFGGRLFRMQRLGSVESEALRTRFRAWWASPDVRQL